MRFEIDRKRHQEGKTRGSKRWRETRHDRERQRRVRRESETRQGDNGNLHFKGFWCKNRRKVHTELCWSDSRVVLTQLQQTHQNKTQKKGGDEHQSQVRRLWEYKQKSLWDYFRAWADFFVCSQQAVNTTLTNCLLKILDVKFLHWNVLKCLSWHILFSFALTLSWASPAMLKL